MPRYAKSIANIGCDPRAQAVLEFKLKTGMTSRQLEEFLRNEGWDALLSQVSPATAAPLKGKKVAGKSKTFVSNATKGRTGQCSLGASLTQDYLGKRPKVKLTSTETETVRNFIALALSELTAPTHRTSQPVPDFEPTLGNADRYYSCKQLAAYTRKTSRDNVDSLVDFLALERGF